MKQLQNEKNVADMLRTESAILFVFVDWSEYARRGAELIEKAEVQFIEKSWGCSVSWWTGDFSSIESPIAPVVHHWLTGRNSDEHYISSQVSLWETDRWFG